MYMTRGQLRSLIQESFGYDYDIQRIARKHNVDIGLLAQDVERFARNFVADEKYDSTRHPGDVAADAARAAMLVAPELSSLRQVISAREEFDLQGWASDIIEKVVKKLWNAPPEPEPYGEYE